MPSKSSTRSKSSYNYPRSAKNVKILFKMPRESTEVPNTDASISVFSARKRPHCHTTRDSNSNLSLV